MSRAGPLNATKDVFTLAINVDMTAGDITRWRQLPCTPRDTGVGGRGARAARFSAPRVRAPGPSVPAGVRAFPVPRKQTRLQALVPLWTVDCDVVTQKTSSCGHARGEDAFENDVAVPHRKVSMTMKCSTVALVLALVQLATGVGLTALSIHTMLKLRSLTTRDCPLWAAAPLLSSGIVAIITVYSNSHYKSQSNRKPIFVLKAVSFALSSLSGILCFVAASFLVLHVLLYIDRYSDCHDQGQHCLCTMNDSRLYRYAGVNCAQVRGTVKALFYVTASVSAVGGLASVWLLALLWSSRYVYFQAGLRPPGPNEANRDAAADVYEQYSANPEPS